MSFLKIGKCGNHSEVTLERESLNNFLIKQNCYKNKCILLGSAGAPNVIIFDKDTRKVDFMESCRNLIHLSQNKLLCLLESDERIKGHRFKIINILDGEITMFETGETYGGKDITGLVASRDGVFVLLQGATFLFYKDDSTLLASHPFTPHPMGRFISEGRSDLMIDDEGHIVFSYFSHIYRLKTNLTGMLDATTHVNGYKNKRNTLQPNY
jgi:hypothetical protein